jgi:UDP-glucuronate 4-epimerase
MRHDTFKLPCPAQELLLPEVAMSILVTGGAGFIGSHLIERLLLGSTDDVICLDNFNDYYDPQLKRANVIGFGGHPRLRIVEASFCNDLAMDCLFARHEIEAVVHLGAYAGVRASLANPLIYEETNVRGTLVLLEMARRYGVRRFVFCSSSTVYGRGVEAPFREDGLLGVPLSPYGVTKRAAELMVLTYVDLYGLSAICVRPFSVYGPRLRPDLALMAFADAIFTERPVSLYDAGRGRRDFTHIDDICDGLIAALNRRDVSGEIVNLGHQQPVEMRKVLALLASELGVTPQVEHRPPVMGEMAITCADLSKAEHLLGYRPRVAIADGIRGFVKWLKGFRECGVWNAGAIPTEQGRNPVGACTRNQVSPVSSVLHVASSES